MAQQTPQAERRHISGWAPLERIGERLIVRLSAEVSRALPSRGQVAVDAVLDGYASAVVVEPDGRKGHWLNIDNSLRSSLGLSDGDVVTFELIPTKAWPEAELPADVADALEAASDAAGQWQDITPMARWEWVRWINATKNPATRARRIEVTVSKLRAGSRRPCCFDLSSCTDPELSKSGKLIDAR